MAEVAVQVPARLAPAVRETAVLLYRSTVEALHQSLGGQSASEARLHRTRLRQLDRVLDQLGWPGDPVAGVVELTAEQGVLHDALHGALIDAGERLAVACEAGWRGDASAASVRELAAEVIELDRLARAVEAKGGR